MYYLNPSEGAGCETRSIFKPSLKGLNLEVSFIRPIAMPKLENPVCLLFTQSWRENSWMHTFPKRISAM